jgi:hypothetical protein
MEAPGRLPDKEDAMSFPSFRTIAAAAVLMTLLGLSAVPAHAESRGYRTSEWSSASVLDELWRWLVDFWAPTGGREQMWDRTTFSSPDDATSAIRRGITVDPNG